MKLEALRIAAVVALAAAAALPASGARAEVPDGCKGFAWPLDVEQRWLADKAKNVRSGMVVTAPPTGAMQVALEASASATLSVEPTGKPKSVAPQTFAGTVGFHDVGKPGLYQVSLSTSGWIDVVQNGEALKSTAHTGSKDCKVLHKSVRFEIGPGPFSLQFSSMPADKVDVVIRPASE